jgi:hypothetical protein
LRAQDSSRFLKTTDIDEYYTVATAD